MFKRCGLILSLLLVFMVTPLAAQMVGSVSELNNVLERMGEGYINWSVGTVRATGIGAVPENVSNPVQAAAMAKRAAVTVARRNLLEIVKGVRVDSETVVNNFVTASDLIKTQVRGFIQGAQIVEEKNLSYGGVEVVMEIKLRGPFADTVLPKVSRIQIPPAAGATSVAVAQPDKVYTGLVVDARGLGVRPAMAPKVLNEKGEEFYGSAYVSRDYAIQQGMAGYSRDVKAASENERVTDSPLIVKAIKASGSSNSDLIISDQDAQTLQNASRNLKFLNQCKVMIVVD